MVFLEQIFIALVFWLASSFAETQVTAALKIDLFRDKMNVLVMDAELSRAMDVMVKFHKEGRLDLDDPNKKLEQKKKAALPLYVPQHPPFSLPGKK